MAMEWWGSPGSQTAAVVETSANLVRDNPTCSEWDGGNSVGKAWNACYMRMHGLAMAGLS